MRFIVLISILLLATPCVLADLNNNSNLGKIFFRDSNGVIHVAMESQDSVAYREIQPGEIEVLQKGQVRLNGTLYRLSDGQHPFVEKQNPRGEWQKFQLNGFVPEHAKLDVDGAGNFYLSTPESFYAVTPNTFEVKPLKGYTGTNTVADPAKLGIIHLNHQGQLYEIESPQAFMRGKKQIGFNGKLESIQRLDSRVLVESRYGWGTLANTGERSHSVRFHDYEFRRSQAITSLSGQESAAYVYPTSAVSKAPSTSLQTANVEPIAGRTSANPTVDATIAPSNDVAANKAPAIVFDPEDYVNDNGEIDVDALMDASRRARASSVASEGAPELNPKKPKEFALGIRKMKSDLKNIVVGQDPLVNGMVDAYGEVLRGIDEKEHRTVLITGPTGAGKTYTADSLIDYVFKNDGEAKTKNVLRVQGNTFQVKQDVWRLIGGTTGHIGTDETKGMMPDFIENAVEGKIKFVVVDEAEKMHSAIWAAMMEVLDKGKLGSGDGKTRQFGKTIFILTSNKGSDEIIPRNSGQKFTGKQLRKRAESFTDKQVKEWFIKPDSHDLDNVEARIPPAIMNRVDKAYAVAPVSKASAMAIVRTRADQLSEQMLKQNGYSVHLDDRSVEEVVNQSFVPEDGVRRPKQLVSAIMNSAETEGSIELDAEDAHQFVVSPRLTADGHHTEFTVQDVANPGKSVTVPFKITPHDSTSIEDATHRTLLSNFEPELKKRVFGQDYVLDEISKAIRARAVNSEIKTPLKFGLYGSTGTGKTEIGSSLAEVFYGDRAKSKVLAMGNIKRVEELSNIFGSARGLTGSNTLTPFEQFLISNKDGGVVIFDEFGNAGIDAAQKEAIQTRLYEMTDGGIYTTQHGEEIDLRKFMFVTTSNEGEELFRAAPSDDLRMAAYDPMKSPKAFQDYLKEKHGYKEAFMARQDGNVFLMKPLLKVDRTEISRTLLGKQLNAIKRTLKLKNVEIPHDFYQRMGETFFTHEGGARAIRSIGERDLADLFARAALDKDTPLKLTQNAKFKLELHDSKDSDVMIGRGKNRRALRNVKVSLKVELPDGTVKHFENEVTERVNPKKVYDALTARKIAIHEAGHAVVNLPEMTEQEIKHITIRGAGNYGGYARYSMNPDVMSLNRENIIHRVAGVLGGTEAQKAFGFGEDSGWASDLEQANKMAESAVAQYGLTDQALKLPVKDGKVIIESPAVQAEIHRILEEGHKLAKARIRDEFAAVVSVAEELLKNGEMDDVRFKALVEAASTPEYKKYVANRLLKRDRRLKGRSIPEDSCLLPHLRDIL